MIKPIETVIRFAEPKANAYARWTGKNLNGQKKLEAPAINKAGAVFGKRQTIAAAA